jgi:hypothetical protein
MNQQLQKLLAEIEESNFSGTVEIGYQNGRPGFARVTQTTKFDATNRSTRGETSASTAY